MTEIQQNRWDQLVRRVAGIVGGGSQVNDTLNELFPVIDVERVPGELLALMGTTLGWCASTLPAVAAVRNHHQLFNPVGSNMMLTVTQCVMSGPADLQFRFSNFIGALTTLAGNERRRDTRAGTLATVVAQQRTAQDVVGGGLDMQLRTLANTTNFLRDDDGIAVLFPGTGLTVTAQTLNIGSTVGFFWRERVFQESERIVSG